MAITLRTASHDSATTKGSPLTHAELDANFTSFLDSGGSALVGFLPSGSGASSRTAQAKLRDIVSVKDFGATGDGTTNDAAAIQAAIDAYESGGAVYFPAGDYNLGTTALTITAGSDILLLGANRESVVLTYTGTSTALTIGDSATDTTAVGLQGFALNCTGAAANGISCVRTKGGFIRDVYIQGVITGTDSGVGLSVQGTGDYAGNMEFTRMRINGNWTKAMHFDGPSTNTCNNHTFRGIAIGRTTTKPGTGTIGFHWDDGCGDGVVLNTDVEGYDTGIEADGRYLIGVVRVENCTDAVAYSSTSNNNSLTLQGFTNTNALREDGTIGSFNSLYDTKGVQALVNTGAQDSQFTLFDATDHKLDLIMRAGLNSDQQVRIRFLDRSGTEQWKLYKSSINDLIIDDGSGTVMRFVDGNSTVQMTKAFSRAQGAALTAANNLTLGTDGDYFQVGGATQINLLASTGRIGGSTVTLKFNSTPTVKHNQAASGNFKPILLAGAVDFVASASDTLTLVYDSTDSSWYEVSRAVI